MKEREEGWADLSFSGGQLHARAQTHYSQLHAEALKRFSFIQEFFVDTVFRFSFPQKKQAD